MILGMSRRFAPFSFLLQALLVWFLCSGAGAAPPPFEDSMAQRVLACTACHGDQGRLDWQALGYPGDPMDWGGRFSQK